MCEANRSSVAVGASKTSRRAPVGVGSALSLFESNVREWRKDFIAGGARAALLAGAACGGGVAALGGAACATKAVLTASTTSVVDSEVSSVTLRSRRVGMRVLGAARDLESRGARPCSTPAAPMPAFVLEGAGQAALLLNQRAVQLRHARVGQERGKNVQRRFGVRGRAVCVLQHDAQALHDIAKRAALLQLLQLARPNQRIDPLHPFAKRRRGLHWQALDATELGLQYPAIVVGVVRHRHIAFEASVQLGHDRVEGRRVFHFVVADAVDLERLLRIGRPGLTSQLLRSTITPSRPKHARDFDDSVQSRIAARRFGVDGREAKPRHRVIRGKFVDQAGCHDAQQVRNAGIVTPARKTAVIGADDSQRVPALGLLGLASALLALAGAALPLGAALGAASIACGAGVPPCRRISSETQSSRSSL